MTASSMAGNGVEITGLVKVFGGMRAIDGVDLSIQPGEFIALLGLRWFPVRRLFDLVSVLSAIARLAVFYGAISALFRAVSRSVAAVGA